MASWKKQLKKAAGMPAAVSSGLTKKIAGVDIDPVIFDPLGAGLGGYGGGGNAPSPAPAPAPDPNAPAQQYQQPQMTREDVMANFMTSPGQEYQLEQANIAAKRQLSSMGLTGSGAELKELQRIAQGQATGEWDKYVSGLQSLAGIGQTSAGQSSEQAYGLGQSLGDRQYSSANLAGREAAQSSIAQSNIVGNVLGQGLGAVTEYMGQRPQQPQYTFDPGNYGMTNAGGAPVPGGTGMRPPSQINIPSIA